jgi:TrpR-related protein YerC/YecD
MSTKTLRKGGLAPELNEKRMARLYDALLGLKTREEYAAFLRDLCTVSELEAMSERLEIAERVSKDESYMSIAGATGASTTTVTRVAHWLKHGMGGYPLDISRLAKKAP